MVKLVICSIILIPLAIITNMYAAKLLPNINETWTFIEFLSFILLGITLNLLGFANFITILTLI